MTTLISLPVFMSQYMAVLPLPTAISAVPIGASYGLLTAHLGLQKQAPSAVVADEAITEPGATPIQPLPPATDIAGILRYVQEASAYASTLTDEAIRQRYHDLELPIHRALGMSTTGRRGLLLINPLTEGRLAFFDEAAGPQIRRNDVVISFDVTITHLGGEKQGDTFLRFIEINGFRYPYDLDQREADCLLALATRLNGGKAFTDFMSDGLQLIWYNERHFGSSLPEPAPRALDRRREERLPSPPPERLPFELRHAETNVLGAAGKTMMEMLREARANDPLLPREATPPAGLAARALQGIRGVFSALGPRAPQTPEEIRGWNPSAHLAPYLTLDETIGDGMYVLALPRNMEVFNINRDDFIPLRRNNKPIRPELEDHLLKLSRKALVRITRRGEEFMFEAHGSNHVLVGDDPVIDDEIELRPGQIITFVPGIQIAFDGNRPD
ncbi:MAG: hypothetical protein HY540_03700 [Deltaproteobacteria bacterium]|nr:hypothetical protein [Deltaproteobacteria bacterium]